MKKTFLLLLIANFAISLYNFAQPVFNYQKDFKSILAKTKDANDPLSYDKLVKRFKTNDTTLSDREVLVLMIGFTAKPDYKPYDDAGTEREIYDLNGSGKFNDAIKKANSFLKTHPLSLKGLYEKSYAFFKLGRSDSADFYLIQGKRILRAMSYSGDGKTMETAMFALGPIDGQDYIQKVIGADIGMMGDGKDKNGNFIDILEAKPEGASSFTLYFIIQHAVDKMFGGKSIEEELNDQKKKDEKKNGK